MIDVLSPVMTLIGLNITWSSRQLLHPKQAVNHGSWCLNGHFKLVMFSPVFEMYLSSTAVCISLALLSKCPLFRASRQLAPLASNGEHMSLCILWWTLDLPEEGASYEKSSWEWCNQTGITLDPFLFCCIKNDFFQSYIYILHYLLSCKVIFYQTLWHKPT